MVRPDNHHCTVRTMSPKDIEKGMVHLPVLVGAYLRQTQHREKFPASPIAILTPTWPLLGLQH